MPIYTVDLETLGLKNDVPAKATLKMSLLIFVIGLPLRFSADCLWPIGGRQSLPMSFLDSILFAFVCAIGVGAVFLFLLRGQKLEQYELIVDGDGMQSKSPFPVLFKYSNFSGRIHRGQVRTIVERKCGLIVSERNRFGTWFFGGGVWIPKQLPEYESLKLLAIGWKSKLVD